MKSGWLDSTEIEFKVKCIKAPEEDSDDFKLSQVWADPSLVLPKEGVVYKAATTYGLRLHVKKGEFPYLTPEFRAVIYSTSYYVHDQLIVFDSVDKFNRYFTIQGE